MRLADLMTKAASAHRKGAQPTEDDLTAIIEEASQTDLATLLKQGIATGVIAPQQNYK